MSDAEYLKFAADVLEECVRILKRHNDDMAEPDKFLYADENEPDKYRNEDERLDDPRHGQAEGLNRERYIPEGK